MNRPTQVDVARIAGVSRATVSYVLNGLTDGRVPISEETRQRVLEAIEELGYEPDARAQALRSGSANTVALIIPDLQNPHFCEYAAGIEEAARAAGYHLLLSSTTMNDKYAVEIFKDLARRRFDGLIIASSFILEAQEAQTILQQVRECGLPIVEMDENYGVDSVSADYHDATREVMSYLLSLGHRRIGLIYGIGGQELGQDRLQPYLESLKAAKIPIEKDLIGGYRIRTGFVGTPLMCDALCSTGNYLAAYRLLLQQENPSWLYPVTMGATTVWERWDSMLPDGTINPGEMTSFNHYALGAVADWMHRTIGGLTPIEPGYRRIEIRPRPGGGLTHAQARHVTPYGLAESSWKIEDGRFNLNVIIPPNTTAHVTLPNGEQHTVGSGTWHWSNAYQDPDARGPFTVDDLAGDIMSDKRASTAIMDVLVRVGAPAFVQGMIFGERNIALRQALRVLPNHDDAAKMINDALAEL